MDEQKLTDWFPPEVLPVRPGWYQREWPSHPSSAMPDFFDGRNWFIGYNWRPYKYPLPVPLRWRGLADPPLTDWFDPDTPPEREGVYELDDADDDGRCFARFDGEHWYYGVWEFSFGKRQDVLHRALLQPVRRHGSRFYRWRGLAVQP